LRDDRTLDAFAMSPSISARTAAHASLLSIHDVQQRFDARETCGNKARPASRDGLIRSVINGVKRFVALFVHERLHCFSLQNRKNSLPLGARFRCIKGAGVIASALKIRASQPGACSLARISGAAFAICD
jgi:hypothetical protein